MKVRLFVFLCSIFMFCSSLVAQSDSIDTPSLRISLVTCAPGDKIYELYGHTAIRVVDKKNDLDIAFNYGIFNFDTPNFVYRFVKGDTDYMLYGYQFRDFLFSYVMRNSTVVEQVLNLSPQQTEALFVALQDNASPQNCTYRYNFLYDNCSTRARNIIAAHLPTDIQYTEPSEKTTFRSLIAYYSRGNAWNKFGIDLALGAPLDDLIPYEYEMFAPEILYQAFEKAQVDNNPLVSETVVLFEAEPEEPQTSPYPSPMVVGSLLFFVVALLSFLQWRVKKRFKVVDALLFTLYGLAGCIIFFLVTISTHPATHPNYSLLWLNPIYLVAVPLLFIPKAVVLKKIIYTILTTFVVLFLVLSPWLPQQFNLAFYPLSAAALLRLILLMYYTFSKKQ